MTLITYTYKDFSLSSRRDLTGVLETTGKGYLSWCVTWLVLYLCYISKGSQVFFFPVNVRLVLLLPIFLLSVHTVPKSVSYSITQFYSLCVKYVCFCYNCQNQECTSIIVLFLAVNSLNVENDSFSAYQRL